MENRESWLMQAIEEYKSGVFKQAGCKIPSVKVSVGLPHGRGSKKAIGQCWDASASDDKRHAIFVSPTIDDSQTVLTTLVHELVHSVVGIPAKHGPAFRKVALSVGLKPPMKSTPPSEDLILENSKVIKAIGKYPHAKLNLLMSPTKKQTVRMLKMQCEDCGYIARASRTCIETFGLVICPCSETPMKLIL